MSDLINNLIELLKPIETLLLLVVAIVVAVITLMGKLGELLRKLGELWQKVLIPILKWPPILILLMLFVPIGIIIWAFILYIATNLTSSISDREVFLSVVFWLTIITSTYSLVWGIWLYPVLIRPRFNKQKTKKPAKENKVNGNEVDENENQNQSVQSPNVAELNQPLNNQGGGTL
jgi:hypothetical protein